jgi:hypothetical protein
MWLRTFIKQLMSIEKEEKNYQNISTQVETKISNKSNNKVKQHFT